MSTIPATTNYSIYAILVFYGIAFIPAAYAAYLIIVQSKSGKYDNANPRGEKFHTHLKRAMSADIYQRWERSKAAHNNSMENLPLFAVAVLAANLTNLDVPTLNYYSAAFLVCRLLYVPAYIYVTSPVVASLRSCLWIGGVASCVTLLLKAGAAVAAGPALH